MSNPSLYEELCQASVSIGQDPLLVQGGGGNSSVKAFGRLLVKASGHWLADAGNRDMFAVLDLAAAKQLALEGAGDFTPAVRGDKSLRPSIETAMHALMPHRCVLHAHPVDIIVRSLIGAECSGYPLLDYTKPGQRLAQALNELLEHGRQDVIILANHGIVVGARRPQRAESRLRNVCEELAMPIRITESAPADLPELPGYTPLSHPLAIAVASDETAITTLTCGALVPDQVVYLGGGCALAKTVYSLPQVIAAFGERQGTLPGLIVLEGFGLYIREGLGAGAKALAGLLVDIALRVPKGADVNPLSAEDEAALRVWDAEIHRQEVDASRSASNVTRTAAA